MFKLPQAILSQLPQLSRSDGQPLSWRLLLAALSSVIGIVAIIGGLVTHLTLPDNKLARQDLAESIDQTLEVPNELDSDIVVEVSGAIAKPGVYRLDVSSRVGDAINLAGGWIATTDHSWLAAHLNLAQPLSDGEKVYIPQVGETISSNTNETKSNQELAAVDSDKTSINSASLVELEALTGIGAKRAEALISNRPYAALEELVTKKVLSESLFSDLQNQLTL